MEKSEYRKIFEAGERAGLERAVEIADETVMLQEKNGNPITAVWGASSVARLLRAEMDKEKTA